MRILAWLQKINADVVERIGIGIWKKSQEWRDNVEQGRIAKKTNLINGRE